MEPNVKIFPSDGGGCGSYRMIWPGQAASRVGKPVTVAVNSPPIAVGPTGEVHGINVGPNVDIAVFQRPASYQMPQVIDILHENGVKVVIDMDDSLSTIHPRNKAYRGYDPLVSHRNNWMIVAQTCEMADWVIVTTEKLAEEYGKHGRVSIVPNHIPERFLKIQRPENPVPVVGWAGYTKTHCDDLRVTAGMINQVLIDTGAKFAAFGDEDIFTDLGIRRRPPHELWGFEGIGGYPNKLVGFDIGLVPLKKGHFNEAKSWLKGLEYASLGIVPIVTPMGDYHNLIDLGIAIPASTPKEWYDRTKELILDHDMRNELSEKCRAVAADWTIEDNTDKWWGAWTSA